MTRVTLTVSDDLSYERIHVSGHSGYAEEGVDIVCAAASSATELVVNILEQFSVDISLEVNDENADVLVIILDGESNRKKKDIIRNIVEGYKSYIEDLAEAYPKFVKISMEV